MTDDRFDRIRDLFLAAAALPPGERGAFLAGKTDDPSIRDEVLALLEAREKSDRFLDTPAVQAAGQGWIGRTVGGYRIEEILARGGMGIVFRASQEKPRRAVALKLIRSDLPSERTLKRFALEAEVLGLLDHPDIAQIFEAGTVDTGSGPQPFFAMELIDGLPLTEYADTHDLDRAARLRLVARVARAVHHAHGKGIVHRDLKPGNVLVRPDGQPKVLDFGVARVTDADFAATQLTTLEGQLMGTLAYMSPEQVLSPGGALDGRADVYSLGVILFELLTGRLPRPLDSASVVEAARAMETSEPETLSDGATRFPRDLETIAGKALETDPARRYATALHLADDLDRYLANEPIAARPPSAAYQFSKFARRNRGPVIGGTIAVLALVAALAVSLVGLERTRAALALAEVEQEKARTLNGFLLDMMEAPDPWADGGEVKVVEVLDRTGARIDSVLADQPEVAASAHTAIGTSYYGLARYAEVEPHYARALELHREHLPADDPRRFLSLRNMGQYLVEEGRMDEAALLEEETRELLARIGEDSMEALDAYHFLGMYADAAGDPAASDSLLTRCLELSEERLGPEDPATLSTRSSLGSALLQLQDLDRARDVLEPAYESLVRVRGRDHPSTLVCLNNLAFVYKGLGDHDRALSMFQRSLETRVRVFGEPNSSTATGHHNLALQLGEMDRGDDALPHHDAAIGQFTELFGADHVRVHIAGAAKGGTLLRMDRPREAEPVLRRAYDGMAATLPEGHWRLVQLAGQLAAAYESLDDEARAARFRALARRPEPLW